MTEFFYYHECGYFNHNQTTVKHHFSFGDFYQPTRLGRSSLRRLDHIALNGTFKVTISKPSDVYILPQADFRIALNDQKQLCSADKLIKFDTTKGDQLVLHSDKHIDLIFAVCTPDDETTVQILQLDGQNITPKNPFFGLILQDKECIISDITLKKFDGFYTSQEITYQGTTKILAFSMPVTL